MMPDRSSTLQRAVGTRALPSKRVSVSPDKLPIILLGSFDDALRGGAPSAEGRNEGAVLAAQDHYVRVRLVEVVVELGKPELFHLFSSPVRHQEEGSATRGVGRRSPPDPPARTAVGAHPRSARPPPRAPLLRSDPPPCRAGPFAPLSCGGRPPSLAFPRVHLLAASWLVATHSRRWARS